MDYSAMTVPQIEQEISTLSDSVAPIRAEMAKAHDAMEAKIRATPISATDLDQVMRPGTDWISFFKRLPADGIAALKKLAEGGK